MNTPKHFEQFLSYFEAIELPITLTEDLLSTFDQHVMQIPAALAHQFLGEQLQEVDEFTEYIPCFSLPIKKEYHALVYWKAALLSHEYFLATFNKQGQMLDNVPLSGLKSDGQKLLRSVATIGEDLIIHVAAGLSDANEEIFDPSTSYMYYLELMPNGAIIKEE